MSKPWHHWWGLHLWQKMGIRTKKGIETSRSKDKASRELAEKINLQINEARRKMNEIIKRLAPVLGQEPNGKCHIIP